MRPGKLLSHLTCVAGNKLRGQLPVSLQDLRVLTRVSLDNNNLTGSIPPELFQFPLLTNFNLVSAAMTSKVRVLGAPLGAMLVSAARHCSTLAGYLRPMGCC